MKFWRHYSSTTVSTMMTFKKGGGVSSGNACPRDFFLGGGGGWGGSLLSSLLANFLRFVLLLDSIKLLLQSCIGATEQKTNKKSFFWRKNKKVKKGDNSVRFCASRYFCFHFFSRKISKNYFFFKKSKLKTNGEEVLLIGTLLALSQT
jgi:hypothetical protein